MTSFMQNMVESTQYGCGQTDLCLISGLGLNGLGLTPPFSFVSIRLVYFLPTRVTCVGNMPVRSQICDLNYQCML